MRRLIRSAVASIRNDCRTAARRAAHPVVRNVAAGFGVESLERRVMLTTLASTAGNETTFEYVQDSQTVVRIALGGAISAEFIGAEVDASHPNSVVLGDLQQGSVIPTGTNVPANFADTIYAIYITSASPGSYISIAEVPAETTTPAPRPMEPYAAGVTLQVNAGRADAATPRVSVTGTASGGVVIGARTVNPTTPPATPTNNVPILSATQTTQAFGAIPSGTTIYPGITSKPGVDVNEILIGGTVLGKVQMGGSINTFYAGDLDTGSSRGVSDNSGVTIPANIAAATSSDLNTLLGTPNNFAVAGDARAVYATDSIGGFATAGQLDHPTYDTGFQLVAGGRIGTIQAGGSFIGSAQALQTAAGLGDTPYQEVEGRETTPPNSSQTAFQDGLLDAPVANNDSVNTAQVLGTLPTSVGGTPSSAIVEGMLNGEAGVGGASPDTLDNYAITLLAGQTVSAQTVASTDSNAVPLVTSVTDPDGRGIVAGASGAFQFTADRPGEYVFTVAFGKVTLLDPETYALSVFNVGNVSFGGIRVGQDIDDNAYGSQSLNAPVVAANFPFFTATGDLGELTAGGSIVSGSLPLAGGADEQLVFGGVSRYTIGIPDGNLRLVQAGSIGVDASSNEKYLDNSTSTLGINLSVPDGSVGLIRSTTGSMALNTLFDAALGATTAGGSFSALSAASTLGIGGSYQDIDADTVFRGNVVANVAIGTIHAGSMATTFHSVFYANADRIGQDGIIDLIDVGNDGTMGTLAGGGPAIATGPGGDVRFIQAAEGFFVDSFFGNSEQANNPAVYDPGVSATITDDSGAVLVITPTAPASTFVANPLYNANDPSSGPQYTAGPLLALETYPIEGSGGSVIVKAIVTGGGMTVTNQGGGGANGTAEISQASIAGTDVTIAASRTTNGTSNASVYSGNVPANLRSTILTATPKLTGADATAYSFIAKGNKTDILQVLATGAPNEIVDDTGGDLIGTGVAGSVGTISSTGAIGSTTTVTGGPLLLRAGDGGVAAAFPFASTGTPAAGVGTGGFAPANTNTPVGIIVSGNVVNLTANKSVGNVDVGGAAITAAGAGTPGTLTAGSVGRITANADHAVAAGGFDGISGPIAIAGSLNIIDIGSGIADVGNGSFVQAGLFVGGSIAEVRNQGQGSDIRGSIVSQTQIGAINLPNGAFIDAIIVVSNTFLAGLRGHGVTGLTGPANSSANRPVAAIANVTTTGTGGIIGTTFGGASIGSINAGGFGIINSTIYIPGNGSLGGITAGGFGIRGVKFQGGLNVGNLTANGNGQTLSVASFTPSVRASETIQPDPNTGVQFNPNGGQSPNIDNDLDAALSTSAAVPSIPGVTDSGVIDDTTIAIQGSIKSVSAYTIRDGTILSAANSVGSLSTGGIINGLTLTTGKLGTFKPASDVLDMDLTVAGPINAIKINGSLANNSSINATGPSGRIKSLAIARDLAGTVSATSNIGKITVGGNVSGTITVLGATNGNNIGTLIVGGTIGTSSLVITGSIGTIQLKTPLGSTGDTITVNGNLKNLTVVGGLSANLVVTGTLGLLNVKNGEITGNVSAGDTINSLVVTHPGATAAAGTITAGNAIKSIKITGNVASTARITAGVSLAKLTVLGTEAAGITVSNGTFGTITIDGDLGDGTDALPIAASSGRSLIVKGSINSGVAANISGALGQLQVLGNVNAGATVAAGSIGKKKILGQVNGTVTP